MGQEQEVGSYGYKMVAWRILVMELFCILTVVAATQIYAWD